MLFPSHVALPLKISAFFKCHIIYFQIYKMVYEAENVYKTLKSVFQAVNPNSHHLYVKDYSLTWGTRWKKLLK